MQTRVLKNNFLQIDYRTDTLRITGITPRGKSNLLVDLSDMPPIPTPYGDFHFQGGHRLWHAPEAMPRTYIPERDLKTTEFTNGVLIEAATEPDTGIRKSIKIELAPDKPFVTLTHTLANDGMWSAQLAPWAITQFRLGGTVTLPMTVGNTDPAGLLHNRQLSIWPYTRMNDPRVTWGDDVISFKADALLPPFKIGYWNTHGWITYALDGILFRKAFNVLAGLPHPDNNCNCEMYCNNQFVELETVGPLVDLAPGAAVVHVETWELESDPG